MRGGLPGERLRAVSVGTGRNGEGWTASLEVGTVRVGVSKGGRDEVLQGEGITRQAGKEQTA